MTVALAAGGITGFAKGAAWGLTGGAIALAVGCNAWLGSEDMPRQTFASAHVLLLLALRTAATENASGTIENVPTA